MLITLIVALVVLSILILAHELGHFVVAKRVGIKIEEFGLGYPPRIVGKKIGETVYSLNWIPFGGFVRMYGEELEEAAQIKSKQAFWTKSKKARTGVIVAGVLANFLLAIFVFSIVYSVSGIPTPTDRIEIIGVTSGSPAEEVGLREGDFVSAVDGQEPGDLERFTEIIDEQKGNQLEIKVLREENDLSFLVTPRKEPPEGEGPLGVVVSSMEIKKYPFWQMPFRGALEGLREALGWTSMIVRSLGGMVADLATKGEIPREIAGPVGILHLTGVVAQSGILSILQFTGILSINLMILNILPFPALDGGRLVFIGYELVTRRRPKPSLERWINAAGMAFLIFLLSLVTINDILRVVDTTDFLSRLRTFLP